MFIAKGYEWETHQPLIRAVMDLYKPSFVLELGAGYYSTPVFMEYEMTFMTIDNNKEWCNIMSRDFGINVIFHDLGEIPEGWVYNRLNAEQRHEIISYYRNLEIPDCNNLLFVDNFSSCRMLAINTLRDKFNMIIYHDSESLEVNSFDLVNKEGFKGYTLQTSGPCTTLLIKEDKGLGELQEVIEPYIVTFLNKYPNCTLMKLV